MKTILYYVHDPMCSWCWGYRPTWLRLRAALPAHVKVVSVLGGLAPDNEQPMPPELRETIQGHWRKIEAMLGTEFNFDFWRDCQPRRDTYKACRAVLAAAAQDGEEEMIEAIQRAYYLRAMNPSEPETLVRLAVEAGLDESRFRADLGSPAVEDEFRRQLDLRRRLGVSHFPSLVLSSGEEATPVPLDYHDHAVSLQAVETAIRKTGAG